jgi:hypothetical protein
MTGSSRDSKPSLHSHTQHASNRSSNCSSSGGLSRQTSSSGRITPVAPGLSNASQKPRLPPIRQETLTTKRSQDAEDLRFRILGGGRGTRKVPPSATAVMESHRRAVASQLASQAARESQAAEQAKVNLRSAVSKAETLLGSERGHDEQVHLAARPYMRPKRPTAAPHTIQPTHPGEASGAAAVGRRRPEPRHRPLLCINDQGRRDEPV